MALIVVTLNDTPDGNVEAGMLSEPPILMHDPAAKLTPAQVLAMDMLAALKKATVKEDRGLIQLIQ